MSEDVGAILNSPWIRLLLFVLAIAGLPLTFFLHRRGRKEKLPRYDLRSNILVQDLTARYEPLQVTYNRKQVQNVTATRVTIWNAGGETINHDDVPAGDPIIIRPHGQCEILEAKKVKENKPANNFRISRTDDGAGVKCEFEYIDKGQGVVIQLIHTGKGDDDLEISGTVKGAPNGGKLVRKKFDVAAEEATTGMLLRLAFGGFGLLFVLGIYGILSFFSIASTSSIFPTSSITIEKLLAMAIVLGLFFTISLLIINAGNLRTQLPKDLRYGQEF